MDDDNITNTTTIDEDLVAEDGIDLFESAETLSRIKLFPYFDIAHYIIVCLMVRDDHYSNHISGPKGFHRNHPLACWMGCMMLSFAPSLFSNFLLGEPLLLLTNHELHVTLATIVWYLVNYCPLDLVYTAVKFLPIQVVLLGMEEVLRVGRIQEGTMFAISNFQGAFTFVCLFGSLRGTAVLHMRLFQRLMCGKWTPCQIEVLEPSPISKASLLAGISFTLYHHHHIHLPFPLFYSSLVVFFLVVKFFWTAFSVDIFKLVENLVGFVLFGGFLGWLDRRRHRKEFEHLGQDTGKNKKYK